MLNFMVWFVVGVAVGGAASLFMRVEDDQDTYLNVLVGVLAALAVGRWLPAHFDLLSEQIVNFGAMALALVGAVVLLTFVGWRRGRSAVKRST